MAPRPALERLKARPDPKDWKDDELVTLSEAAALFFPRGPLTADGLRIAYNRGQLAGILANARIYTTPASVRSMMKPVLAVKAS